MANTLGLNEDLDPVDLQMLIEDAFGLRMSDAEASSVVTVGDLHETIRRHVAVGPGACMTSMAFYRLRRALREFAGGQAIRPDMRLKDLPVTDWRALKARVEAQTGLSLPAVAPGRLTLIGLVVVLASVLTTAILAVLGHGAPAAAVLVAGVVCAGLSVKADPGTGLHDVSTIGDLARRTAALSFSRLAGRGAAVRTGDTWPALLEVLATMSDVPPERIRAETRIIA